MTDLIVGEVQLIQVWKAGGQELWNGSSQISTIQVQFFQVLEQASLLGYGSCDVLICDVKIGDNTTPWKSCIVCKAPIR